MIRRKHIFFVFSQLAYSVHFTIVCLSFMALLAAGFPSLGSGKGVLHETAVAELKQKKKQAMSSTQCV